MSIRDVNRKLGFLHERMGTCVSLLLLIAILCLLDVLFRRVLSGSGESSDLLPKK